MLQQPRRGRVERVVVGRGHLQSVVLGLPIGVTADGDVEPLHRLLQRGDDVRLRLDGVEEPRAPVAGELVGDRLERRLQLVRDPRHDVDVLDHAARREPRLGHQRAASLGDRRLGRDVDVELAVGDALADRGQPALDRLEREVAGGHLAVERVRDRLHRHVVRGAAEAAGDDHGVEVGGVPADAVGDLSSVVWDREDPLHGDAALAQFGREPVGVRVHRVAREQFVPDRDQRNLHRRAVGSGDGCTFPAPVRSKL